MAKRSDNAGRPDFVELEAQNRIQHHKTRGFNLNPNPEVILPNGETANRGHVRNLEFPAWRVGLNPMKYEDMTKKYEELKARSKSADDFRPELTPEEQADYETYLAKQKKESK